MTLVTRSATFLPTFGDHRIACVGGRVPLPRRSCFHPGRHRHHPLPPTCHDTRSQATRLPAPRAADDRATRTTGAPGNRSPHHATERTTHYTTTRNAHTPATVTHFPARPGLSRTKGVPIILGASATYPPSSSLPIEGARSTFLDMFLTRAGRGLGSVSRWWHERSDLEIRRCG